MLLAVACSDNETLTEPRVARPAAAVADRGENSDLFSAPRFDVNVSFVGPVRLGSPMQIAVDVKANLATPQAELRVTLPEVEAARISEWGPQFRLPVGVRLPALASKEMSLGRGQVVREVASVVIPKPGYYRVVVSARSVSDEAASVDGRPVQNVGVREAWMWVDSMGGRVTDQFDRAVFPKGAIQELGPIRFPGSEADRSRGAKQPSRELESVALASTTAAGYLYEAVYYNSEAGRYEPVVNSAWYANFYNAWDDQIGYQGGYTDAAGRFTVECIDGWASWYDGEVLLDDVNIDILSGHAGISAAYTGRCGNTVPVQVQTGSMEGRVFTNMAGTASKAPTRFGRTRPVLPVRVDPNASNSFYDPSADQITIRSTAGSDHVWGSFGIFTSAHEYGHAYHYRAIEPWRTYSCSNNTHFWTETENLSCAFVEGFADFVAMWLEGDRLVTSPFGGDYGVENNVDEIGGRTNPPPNGDGGRVEAAVAAFLYDLVDGDAELDSPSNTAGSPESFDGAVFPASWIADVIQYCRLKPPAPFVTFTRLDGADELVYCLESNLSAYTESQRFSTAWRQYQGLSFERTLPTFDQGMIRRLWKYDMYGVLE